MLPFTMAAHLLPLLLVTLSLLPASKAWNISIDCGASSSYIDGHSIEWTSDESLIQYGESKEVQHEYRPLRTLRVFSGSHKKYCYSITAAIKGEQVLVRASFFYGNYDNQSSAPSFQLQLGGNFWTTVETDIEREVSHEAVYFVKGDEISVCVAKTKPNQLPFISALEVRSLDAGMYGRAEENSALFLQTRIAFGTSKTVRYPDDVYDRIWEPAILDFGLVARSRKEQSIGIDVADRPPQAVLLNAFTSDPGVTKHIIGLAMGSLLPKEEVPLLLNTYFAEVEKVLVNRSFNVFKDNVLLTTEPVVPLYENVTELRLSNFSASSDNVFLLIPTNDSVLSPLINALELFRVSDPLTDGTNSNDVQALASLQKGFDVLRKWSGDPCLPSNYEWDWLNCSTDFSPRVISLNLSGFGLSGPLPDFSSMDALRYIDLHNNSLNGTIPDFLGNLPNLKELNLADNNFSGLLPPSLSQNANRTIIRHSGNANLCLVRESCKDLDSSSPCEKQGNKQTTILAASVSTLVLLWSFLLI